MLGVEEAGIFCNVFFCASVERRIFCVLVVVFFLVAVSLMRITTCP